MSDPYRKRIDEMRRVLLDSFMSEDLDTYRNAVLELERLIGAEHGDRNPKDTSQFKTDAAKKQHAARARQFRWGDRSLDAELHDDGVLIYSIKYQ